MAQAAALTIADGQSSPANHTFSPVSQPTPGLQVWKDQSSGIAIGFPVISLSYKEPERQAPNYRFQAKVVLPVLEQTSPSTATGIQPAPTKAYELIANVSFSIPARSTLADRKDALAYVKNFLATTVVDSMVKNYEAVW